MAVTDELPVERFRYQVWPGRAMVLRADGRWYCEDDGEPAKLWSLADMSELALAAQVERLQTALDDWIDRFQAYNWNLANELKRKYAKAGG